MHFAPFPFETALFCSNSEHYEPSANEKWPYIMMSGLRQYIAEYTDKYSVRMNSGHFG